MFFPDLERPSRERKHDQRLVHMKDYSGLENVKTRSEKGPS